MAASRMKGARTQRVTSAKIVRLQRSAIKKAIYVSPSADTGNWLKAIADAVAMAGLTPVTSVKAPAVGDIERVLITDDIRNVPPSGLSELTIIQATPVFTGEPDPEGEDRPKQLEETAFQLARATEADAREKRWIQVSAADSFTIANAVCSLPVAERSPVVDIPMHAVSMDLYRDGAPAEGATAHWPPEVFVFANRRDDGAGPRNEIDTTGRPRYLMYGPYMALPPGRWQAKAVISLDAGAEKHRFRIEWGTSTLYKTLFPVFERPGVYEIVMEYDWVTSQPADFRIIMLDGSLSGRFVFHGLEVSSGA